jgi:hypothetical protein
MTDLNPKVLEEKADDLHASMAKELEGMDIRDCDLIGAIHSVAHESNQLEGELLCVVLFHGSEEEWFEEREALLRNYELNSIEALKDLIRVPGLSLSVHRTDPNVTLHGQLTNIRDLCAERNLKKYIIYIAQKTQPQLDQVSMGGVFLGQKFDWMFKPNTAAGNGQFQLSLMAAPQGGAKPISYNYQVFDVVPTPEAHAATPGTVFVDLPSHQKVFAILDAEADDYLVAFDLLQMFLTETGQLVTVDDPVVIFYSEKSTETRPVGRNEFDERLFHSERFQGLLPRAPKATIYKATVETALITYGDLLIAPVDPKTELIFISTSMQGEEFANVQEELDRSLAVVPTHDIGLMFHSFVPGSITRASLLDYIRTSACHATRANLVYVSPHFKYKEEESVE